MLKNISRIVVITSLVGLVGCDAAPEESPVTTEPEAQPEADVGEGALELPQRALARGDEGADVAWVYRYLQRFGYFPNPELNQYPGWAPLVSAAPANPRRFDDVLETALELYQSANGLTVTGVVDEATLALMKQPRCGLPDRYDPRAGVDWKLYAASGQRWPSGNLSYQFLSFSPDLSVWDQRQAMLRATQEWSAAAWLFFFDTTGNANIKIGWHTGDHGDGSPFDGVGNTLAHAFYPTDGRLHFDDDETWSINGGGTDLESVALHELGHAIGLTHSPVSSAVMYAYYSGPRRRLTPDDLSSVRSIYGPPFQWSMAGPIPGKSCIQINESADPHTWADNYFCSNVYVGMQWSSAGPIPNMRCTLINESADPDSWHDNYLCVPTWSTINFAWSSAGPIPGKSCVQWIEAADPHTWDDNFLCL